jgi:hypothetical protein
MRRNDDTTRHEPAATINEMEFGFMTITGSFSQFFPMENSWRFNKNEPHCLIPQRSHPKSALIKAGKTKSVNKNIPSMDERN